MAPQRLIKPAYEYVKSPITMRSVALFLALAFLVYTLISDYHQRQVIAERYNEIARNNELSKDALATAKQQNANFELSLKNSSATLIFMEEMAKSMQEVTDILQRQRQEHAVLLNGHSTTRTTPKKVAARPVKKKKVLRKCFDFIPKRKRIGRNEVWIYEGIDIPCD